jgi:hypothetical protein
VNNSWLSFKVEGVVHVGQDVGKSNDIMDRGKMKHPNKLLQTIVCTVPVLDIQMTNGKAKRMMSNSPLYQVGT